MLAEDLSFEPTRDKVERVPTAERGGRRGPDARWPSTSAQAEPERVREAVGQLVEHRMTAAVTTRDPLAVALIRGLASAA